MRVTFGRREPLTERIQRTLCTKLESKIERILIHDESGYVPLPERSPPFSSLRTVYRPWNRCPRSVPQEDVRLQIPTIASDGLHQSCDKRLSGSTVLKMSLR